MTTIAVFGTSGTLGQPVLKALTSLVGDKISYPIKAITSKDKTNESTSKVKFIQGDIINGYKEITAVLEGVDVIISLVKADISLFNGLEQIIKAVKPKLYIPSEFGVDYYGLPEGLAPAAVEGKRSHGDLIEKQGIKVARIFTGLFRLAPIFLYALTNHIGIDQKNKTVTKTDNNLIHFSTGEDMAKVVSVIATSDPSVVERVYRIYSGEITVKEVVNKIEAQEGVKYSSTYKSSAEIVKSVGDDLVGFLFATFSLGPGKGAVFDKDDRELVNPRETVFKWGTW